MLRAKSLRASAPLSAADETDDDALALAHVIALARIEAGLTQDEVAQRMWTTQGNIARVEAGRSSPSAKTLEKFALAVGARLTIAFEPLIRRADIELR
jgi:transcriptional regulator with XRE-family HTH domain